MKLKANYLWIVLLVSLVACDNEDVSTIEVDGILEETLQYAASTDGSTSIQTPAFTFDIELAENPDLSEYAGKVKTYTITKITWQADNYSGPEEPLLYGSLSFGKLSERIPLTLETEIKVFPLISSQSNEFVLELSDSDKAKIETMFAEQSGVTVYWTQIVDTLTLAGDVSFNATVKVYATLTVEAN